MTTKNKISHCLWFDRQAEEAAQYYTSVFSNTLITGMQTNPMDTPSGKANTILVATITLEGQDFMLLNGGPHFKPNPSISFMVNCATAEEVETLWNRLSEGGTPRMALDSYPFSDKYGWIEDQYGVNWQLILPKENASQKVVPSLMFVKENYGKAEAAVHYYTSIFHDAQPGIFSRYPAGMEPDQEGNIMYADFTLEGQRFAAMDSAHDHSFQFDEGVSFEVLCNSQEEIDYYWEKLTANGGKEVQCGWLKDPFGVSWQITPDIMPELLGSKDPEKAKRAMQAMMQMVKLDMQKLKNA